MATELEYSNIGVKPETKEKLKTVVTLGRYGSQLNAVEVLVNGELKRLERKHRTQRQKT